MNIFNKVTLQSLKLNRTRTIVTIIGVILSVSMFTAVMTFISSFQNYLIKAETAINGHWHIQFLDVDSGFAQTIKNDNDVEEIGFTQNVGYALLDGAMNPSKPYLFITGFDDAAFDILPLKLLSGRLPLNGGEVLIPAHVAANSGVVYNIGDMITLEIGNREINGMPLGQYNPFIGTDEFESSGESFISETTAVYTVVGIIERPRFENYTSPGYTVITMTDSQSLGETVRYNVLTILKQPRSVYDFAKRMAGDNGYTTNAGLLRFMGISQNDTFITMLYSFGGILVAIIMFGSVLLIYNSFAISVSERTRQFGILSSVGATNKQLRNSVLFEGFCIGIIGIPLGVLAGIIGMAVTLLFTGDMFGANLSGIPISLSLSVPALAFAFAAGTVTILLSAYIPAKRAVKKSALDIIRLADDIQIKPNSMKTSKITQLFGLEGTLALKNLKRNKRRYRSTVLSLFVSIVLFISASAFGFYLKISVERTINDYGFDIWLSPTEIGNNAILDEAVLRLYEELKEVTGVYNSAYQNTLYCSGFIAADSFSERCIEHWNIDSNNDPVPSGMLVRFIDDATYIGYLESVGLSAEEYTIENGKLPAVAKSVGYDGTLGRSVYFDVFNSDNVTMQIMPGYSFEQNEFTKDITLTIVDKMPDILSSSSFTGIFVYAPYSSKGLFDAPEANFDGLYLFFNTSDNTNTISEMNHIIEKASFTADYHLFNAAESLQQNRNILLVINVFTYGFVILISLITIANVFNTVSTGITLRGREFAMLRSVGMGGRSFNKMMNFECVFYGLKALFYGLPIAVGATYLIYREVLQGVDVSFTLPWSSIGISVFSVFFVVFVTMLYSINKLKKANVIDALRSDIS